MLDNRVEAVDAIGEDAAACSFRWIVLSGIARPINYDSKP